MLVYLDEVIIPQTTSRLLWQELKALRALIQFELEIEQLEVANLWEVAAPAHLMKELYAGKPTDTQRRIYSVLREAWSESDWAAYIEWSDENVRLTDMSLGILNLKQAADRRHLAEAVVLKASWFLTNDTDIITKTRLWNQDSMSRRFVLFARRSAF